jgi:putative ABC transport system permease protein
MLFENLQIAIEQIRNGKARSVLTALGIIIGVATVIFIVSILDGYNQSVVAELNILGANTFQVQKYDPNTGIQVGPRKREKRPNLKKELAEAIRKNVSMVSTVGAEVWNFNQILSYKSKSSNPNLMVAGAEPEFFVNNGYFIKEGRILTTEDIMLSRNVIVLGQDAVEILFPFENPINKTIKIAGNKFRVIGVLEELGNSTFGGSKDNANAIPISVFEKIWGKRRSANITVSVREGVRMEVAVDQVIGVVRNERKVKPGEPNNFGVFTNDTLVESFNNISEKVTLGGIVLGLISLLVGSIGVMNIMLVTVTERTKEIGLRKAVGARKVLILMQFLSESVVLSAIGGFIGIGFGLLLAFITSLLLDIPFAAPFWVISGSVMVTGVVGILAGLYPASRAAKMDPINALRYE